MSTPSPPLLQSKNWKHSFSSASVGSAKRSAWASAMPAALGPGKDVWRDRAEVCSSGHPYHSMCQQDHLWTRGALLPRVASTTQPFRTLTPRPLTLRTEGFMQTDPSQHRGAESADFSGTARRIIQSAKVELCQLPRCLRGRRKQPRPSALRPLQRALQEGRERRWLVEERTCSGSGRNLFLRALSILQRIVDTVK